MPHLFNLISVVGLAASVLFAVAIGFAVPKAFASGASANSAAGALDRQRTWHTDEHTFSLRLNKHVFTVPSDYLGMFTPEEKAVGGRPGMALHALLPTLEADTIPPQQRGPSRANERSLFISVEWPMRDGAADALHAWISGNMTLHVGHGYGSGTESGLQITRADPATAWHKDWLWDMYRAPPSITDKEQKDAVLFCNEPIALRPTSNCRDAFLYHDLLVQLNFNHAYLKDWALIRRNVKARLDGWCLDCASGGSSPNSEEKR